MKLYELLKVKNAVVKPVCYVMEYTICHLVCHDKCVNCHFSVLERQRC